MNHKELLKIKFDQYLAIRGRISRTVGGADRVLKQFQRRYENDLGTLLRALKKRSVEKIIESSTKKSFLKDLRDSKLILVGDFHAQSQSARSFYRLVRAYKDLKPGICLECFRSEDQTVLNQFMRGEIAERDFLRKIRWKESWGFPFETLRPLIRWCQANDLPVFGINTAKADADFKSRDRKMAKQLVQIQKTHPTHRLFVLVGDFHLAQGHLPSAILKIAPKLKLCTILQSPEDIYFEVASRALDHLDLVSLGKRKWALLSVLPWIKWQEYLIFLERDFDRRILRNESDIDEHIEKESHFFLHFLNQNPAFDFHPKIFQFVDDQFYSEIIDRPKIIPKWLQTQIMSLHADGCSFVVSEVNQAFLARPTVNHIARISALIVLHQIGVLKTSLRFDSQNFERLIWIEMLVYFFNKLVNPKKKSDTLGDIRKALSRETVDDRGKEPLQLALAQKLREMKSVASGRHSRLVQGRSYSTRSFRLASEILGSLRGEKLYFAYRKGRVEVSALKKMISVRAQEPYFESYYYDTIELIDSWPSGFGSKYEKL